MIRRILALGACAVACNRLPEVTEVGTYVEVAADPGLELCGGTLAYMDAFVARLSAEVDRKPGIDADRIRLYWLEADDFHERSGCVETALACADDDTAYTPVAPLNHELAHNIADAFGEPLPFFTEGFAVAFEGLGATMGAEPRLDQPAPYEQYPNQDIRDLLAARTGTMLAQADGYPVAGAFTAFLVREHGLAAYMRAYAKIGRRAGRSGVDRVFRDVFGVTLEQSIVDFDATARDCIHRQFDAKLLECEAPELPWQGDTLVHHRSLGCDQDDVVGPFAHGVAIAYYTLSITEPGGYELRVVGDNGRDLAVSLQGCGGCGTEELRSSARSEPAIKWLEPGRYAVRMRGPVDVYSSIGMRLRRIADYVEPTAEE